MIDFNVVAKVDVTITEENLKQIIIEKIAQLRPDVEVKAINLTGSRKKGCNINIDIDAELKGATASKPNVGRVEQVAKDIERKIEAVDTTIKEVNYDIEDLEKQIAEVEASAKSDEMSLIDEVLAEEEDALEAEEEELKITKTTSLADLLS